eukprot:CAMPEP_0201491080 /NCGR_PEP_ID=MMETSP0151_2-20130828/28542_1 /ASSEMBLY_ACC=CAM_ASM_000257 /TAXON_ID=200890 /ORGANISM="Paramoeba atlantica, Strain 621/1 / CCAP 1560/9" /LENGTH=381 /DNA_ID=CAMNT_0047877289 /DNA_START=96 /DNA_END=1238 /DNA_ORIENTATION=-
MLSWLLVCLLFGFGSAGEEEGVLYLNWELDFWLPVEGDSAERLALPALTQNYYNLVTDVHLAASAKDLDLIFSTNGNYHLPLRVFFNDVFFAKYPLVQQSYLFTTSPPVSRPQLESGLMKVGNILFHDAQPHVIAGPGGYLDNVVNMVGPRYTFIRTYGNVILKRKGDDRFQTFWDLKNVTPGRFASSDPAEGGSYNNYRTSVYEIALNNPEDGASDPEQAEAAAAALQLQLFDEAGVATIGPPMHRSLPHMIATNQADAGLIFLHLAIVAMKENPGLFSAVYLSQDLSGEIDDWTLLASGQGEVLEGNRVGQFQLVRTDLDLEPHQQEARENFMEELMEEPFTQILETYGLRRPENFVNDFERFPITSTASKIEIHLPIV